MKISYDYEDIIQLIKGEIKEEFLSRSDTIQILRGPEQYGYEPIIGWYYDKKRMKDLVDIYDNYKNDKKHLVEVRVDEVLEEMERLNKLYPHWLEEVMSEFGIVSRYKLEQLGGPSQATTSAMIKNNTDFRSILLENLLKLVDAIVKVNPSIDKEVLLIGLIRDYTK